MRSKVIINLSTDDPVEAEILDMLTGIKTSHRKQERLRSILKSGYNLLYKNMSADMAMVEAFDKQDVALILSLFGKAPAQAQHDEGSRHLEVQRVPEVTPQNVPPARTERLVTQDETMAQPKVQVEHAAHESVAQDIQVDRLTEAVKEERDIQSSRTTQVTLKKQQMTYREITPQLEEEKIEMLDFDPGLLQLESDQSESEPEEYIDPLKRLFNK